MYEIIRHTSGVDLPEFSHSIHLKDEDTFSHCKFIVSLCQSDVKDNTLLTIFKRIPLHLDENGNNVIVNTIIYKISSEMLSQEEFMKMILKLHLLK
jgi:hypothetical protein